MIDVTRARNACNETLFNKSICVCNNIYAYIYMRIICVYGGVHMWNPGDVTGCLPLLFSILVFETGFLTVAGLAALSRVAGQ